MEELYDLKNKITHMKEQYESRLKSSGRILNDMKEIGLTDTDKYKRLLTKNSCYRNTSIELNKLI